MSSLVSNQDVIQEILSYLPASKIGKFRLLNKESNKRTYESWFLNLHRRRSNSISGYFIQRYEREKNQTSFVHESGDFEKNQVSIEFLPPGKAKIEACDASHGILLCTIVTGPSVPELLIVCKPTTKQYQIIPESIMQNHAIIWGLTVIGLNPFRYKIVRLSKSPRMDRNRRTFVCEVFDSGTFMWKRIKNMRLPKTDGLIRPKPVEAYGCLHWQTWNNNAVRFCPKTEVWSNFPLPNLGEFSALVNYEGKLGVVRRWIDYPETNRLWVLKNKLWEKVKDFNDMGLIVDVMWTPSNDVVMLSSRDRVCFYNTNTEKLKIVKDLANSVCFPFCSDYERVDLNRAYNSKQCCMFFLGLTLLSLCVP